MMYEFFSRKGAEAQRKDAMVRSFFAVFLGAFASLRENALTPNPELLKLATT